ncbi:ABC transporter ATP-binding protein [Clostridium sp. CCUG 7971]|uniref:ABC transporter ATP-binding protein n=1 Tax=Clostridium sp. CCUG 7971 TaxID=2811414 RepID=UPI001ABBA34F|nr:ABC transporter ATP-binding protein [Clostridium sp. CCUG 7971]MBO3444308.1 ABC transporter ATP-binding protein [Clostridium sp. CCUG 7971]
MKEVIKTYGLSKQYKNFDALKDININVKQGDIYGLVGDNGAGKTTLLRILTGQSLSSEGSFELFSTSNDKDLKEVKKHIGVIIESPSFYPNLTIEKNLEYYRIQRGIPGKDKVGKALREVNIYEARKKKFSQLSLGMKQRLGLALCIMGDPELLILDEPINGLDPSGIIEIRNLLLRLNKEKNITILISSHILLELANIATCYGFLNKGRLVKEISARELNENCKSYLEIKVTNANKLAALLEERLRYSDYKVLPQDVIQLFDEDRNPEKVSKLIIKNGIGLSSLEEKTIDLENYYMSLMGGTYNV